MSVFNAARQQQPISALAWDPFHPTHPLSRIHRNQRSWTPLAVALSTHHFVTGPFTVHLQIPFSQSDTSPSLLINHRISALHGELHRTPLVPVSRLVCVLSVVSFRILLNLDFSIQPPCFHFQPPTTPQDIDYGLIRSLPHPSLKL